MIEVSYSQIPKTIPYLVDNYILCSNGNIKAVVGLDVDYKTKKGTVSVWRPQLSTTEEGQIELAVVKTLDALVCCVIEHE